jgi:signal transduction histidine kinase
VLAGLRAWRLAETVQNVQDDNLVIAVPLFRNGQVVATLVAQRQLTEVAAVVGLVRNALLAAAAIGLAVAIGLGLALSGTLTRRLARLRRAALRITREGPEAPMLRDMGRDEVGDLARALARMQEELRRQETARRSFVATASHELRTPLTMLQGTMELLDEDLRDGLDIDDAQEQVANARRELRRLSALASELLDLSRLDAAVQLRSEPVELGELARAVGAEFGLRAAEAEVPIDVVPPPAPCWAKGDPAACARVVRILIDNALRYAPKGEPITVITEQLGDRIIVEVADRGPGVPEDERERIFERFHRGRAAGAESGFGLGLAIGRELAERMNGTLLLEDSDVGACFQLALPATTGSSPSPSPAPDSAAAA